MELNEPAPAHERRGRFVFGIPQVPVSTAQGVAQLAAV